MFDANLCHEIFNKLMNGKIINKTILNNNGQFTNNPLFDEILCNLNDYKGQYDMCGKDFVVENDYVFIRDRTNINEDLKTDITMKAYLLLLIIGKYLTANNYRFSKISDSSGGITIADIEAIQEMPDTQEILEKSKLNNNLHSEIRNILVNRNIMLEKPSSQSYILSDSGKAFFNEVINNFKG